MPKGDFTLVRNILKNAVLLFLFSSLLAPNLLSCYSVHGQVKNIKKVHTEVPAKSFIQIVVSQEIYAVGCVEGSKKYKECLEILDKLPVVKNGSMGSGILMHHKGKKLVLTAAHVCSPGDLSSTEYRGFHINLKTDSSIKIVLQDGKIFDTKIIKVNKELDLCTLAFPKEEESLKPVYMSPTPPKIGARIVNIASPLGLTSKNMVLVFDGRYSGSRGNWHYYTVPARPGSSGSIVLNERYQAVGTVNIAVNGFEHVGIGSGWKLLKWFLDSH